jgi:hypothetical protein
VQVSRSLLAGAAPALTLRGAPRAFELFPIMIGILFAPRVAHYQD